MTETEVNALIKEIGVASKYKREKHIPLLMEVFSKGEDIANFCSKAMVSKQTFYNWLEDHEEFKQVYNIVFHKAEAQWLAYPKENPDCNMQYWYMVMKNRFGYSKPRVRKSKDTTPKGRIESIWQGAEQAEYTADEISKLASLAQTQANIEAGSNVTNQTSVPLTTEELEREIELLRQLKELTPEDQKEQVNAQD